MPKRQRNLRSERELQRHERLAPSHRGQTAASLQPKGLLALRVRQAPNPDRPRRLQRRLSAHQTVLHAHLVRQGLGQRIPPPNRH